MKKIRAAIGSVIVSQNDAVELLLIAACRRAQFARGRARLAKTLMVKTLAASSTGRSARSFTPDLMPADITGYELLGGARVRRGDVPSRTDLRQPRAGR